MTDSMFALIAEELARIAAEKGESLPTLGPDTRFLGGDLPIDSLDLATLLVVLEQRTGQDPFRAGFVQFHTVGELAALYRPTLHHPGLPAGSA
ncbi:phosphopantetheine binding protein [Azospirillum brasilense]|uniref:Phosphopantetheine binding protein n=1 Tax=Azospirillum brasilense TaxID=192 RepID=A0A560CRD9_AZOBR|nr:acyl carrier protein [Azospirillum brasilense]TWA87421.1 phosphopantetheine binding protein [Azospirillum brasilense]